MSRPALFTRCHRWGRPRRWRPLARDLRVMPARMGALRVTALWGAVLCVAVLTACAPTEGETGLFQPLATTNADFDLAAPIYHTVGNQAVTLDCTTTLADSCRTEGGGAPLGTLDLVAVVNSVLDPPSTPDGTFIAAGSVSILRNTAGTFSTLATLDTLQFPSRALWADLDGGANEPDLVVVDDLNLHVGVYLSDGAGSWPATPSQEFTFTDTIAQLTVTDLEGDGDVDVVLTVPADDFIIALYNNPTGTLTRVDTTAIGGLGRFVARDLDGSGTIDLAMLRPVALELYIYNGLGDGTFDQSLPSTVIDGLGTLAPMIVAGDLGSGNVDLAVAGATSDADFDRVVLLSNDGAGTFANSSTTSVSPKVSQTFLVEAQLSGGGADLALVHRNDRIVTFMRSAGTTFTNVELESSRDPIEVVAGDVTGDGIVDLVSAEDDRRVIGVFAGDGAAAFTRTQIGLTTHVRTPRLVDVDGDGILDLMVLQPYSDRIAVFLNVN